MKILIVGGGGREHALAWKIAQSKKVNKVFVAPGNAGTALEPNVENVVVQATDIDQLLAFAQTQQIDLTIVGPEAALAAGIVDRFRNAQLACFGPTQQAAQLETSKSFCKQFMQKYQIPTARFAVFTNKNTALDYLASQQLPIVIKADGLAAGKGVIIAETKEQAEAAVSSMLEKNQFGVAGHKIVIEEFIQGEELSFICMTDGIHILPLASSQDHKRRDDGDRGPNTGGMGAYSPAHLLTESLFQKIMQKVIEPTVQGMATEHLPYLGFLYAGLMITPQGEPKVLEFNCRLGDPETQPIMMRLQSDLVDLCFAALRGQLDQAKAKWDPRSALSVVLAAGGYPDSYSKGEVIMGLDQITPMEQVKVFHAGTQLSNGKIITDGGRVLAVTALGNTLADAKQYAYAAVKKIHWPHCHYRTDIGYRAQTQSELQAQ